MIEKQNTPKSIFSSLCISVFRKTFSRYLRILEFFYYLCNRIQVQITHLSEILSLLVYQGLNFFFIKIQCLAFAYPIQPFGIVFRILTANIIHDNSSTLLVEVDSNDKVFPFVLYLHNHILCLALVAIYKYSNRVLQGFHKPLNVA